MYSHIHKFNDGGLSGVAVLEESHISFHTYQREFMSHLIFLCGDTKPNLAVELIKKEIKAVKSNCKVFKRVNMNSWGYHLILDCKVVLCLKR